MRWTFRRMGRGEVNRETMEWEFFEDENRVTRLVRESIQNSLDAQRLSADGARETTKVRFSLSGIERPLSRHRAEPYLEGLAPHLEAVPDLQIPDLDSLAADGMPYIVVEDAGTVGLEGDHLQYDDSQASEGNHFYWFFRNVGRSGKGENSNGSWGLGKWVFPDSSKLGSFLALTRRRSDDRVMLMGQSVLKIHSVDGERHDPYGYFANLDEHEMALPSVDDENAGFINRFIRDFGIDWRDDRSGLSIVVPFPRMDRTDDEGDGIDLDVILGAVLENYFYAIISGRLEITLEDSRERIEVKSDTIDEMLDRATLAEANGQSGERSPASYRALFGMARECMRMNDDDRVLIPMRDLTRIESNDRRAADIRQRFHAGEIVAVRVETSVRRRDKSAERTHLDLYIQKDDNLSQGHDYYVRGTLSISEMNLIGGSRARALMVIDENEPLAALLRDSEPPAHTTWRSTAERARMRWTSSQLRITEVRGAASRVLAVTERRDDVIQRDVFTELFPMPKPVAQSVNVGKPPGPHVREDRPVYPQPNPQPFRIAQRARGFEIRANPRSGVGVPDTILVQVAYAIPRGNALNSYSELDFKLHGQGAVSVETLGCHAITSANDAANTLIIKVDEPDSFVILVEGFDSNRDLYIRAVPADDRDKELG